ncbi:RNA-binding protein, partial [Pseudomonas sp. CrR25]|nr:RNA-binding protein [Pseudomonas sp. CrR25]
MTDPIRLSKRLIELVGCSRREAELYIEGGWVLVDGQVVEEPQFKVLAQRVELHPDAVAAPLEPVTLLLHVPA